MRRSAGFATTHAAAAILCWIAAPAAVLPAPAATEGAAPAAAILASAGGRVLIDRPGGSSPLPGSLGMRLEPGDTVRVMEGANATIYMNGGAIVKLPPGGRLEIPRGRRAGSEAPAPARLSSPSLQTLEAGLWVLNDPDGSVLLRGMRGGGNDWARAARGSAEILSPRYDTVPSAHPVFLWSGAPGPARVVVGKGAAIVWTSDRVDSGVLVYPREAPALPAGDACWWRLDPPAGGDPLTESIPFRIAADDLAAKSRQFESEMTELFRDTGDADLADLLRCAYYLEAGVWVEMADAARRLAERHNGDDLVERALTGARRQMRLGEEPFEDLLAALASLEPRFGAPAR